MSKQLQLTLDELLQEQVSFNKLPSLSTVDPADMLLVVTALGLVGRATKSQLAPEVEPPPPPPIITSSRITFVNTLTIQWGTAQGYQGSWDGFYLNVNTPKIYQAEPYIALCSIRESSPDRNQIIAHAKPEPDKVALAGRTTAGFLSSITWQWLVIGGAINNPTT